MDDIAIKVENVSKLFKLPHEKHTSIKSAVVNFYRRKKNYEMQHALKNVSFEVKKGEFFGVVGRNGSGKSTLLKLLAGIYTATKGQLHVNGKLTPFIELGVGFNPELSGRDNVYLNGALLGFNRKEMRTMYKDIVEFAELENFMDQKLKNYSSGMQVRLAFSIAIRANTDILLIDEVLAVGDESFQRKCLDIFEQYKANKKTVVLVTHDMDTVKRFCNRALLINEGKVIDINDSRIITEKYSKLNQVVINNAVDKENENKKENKHIKAQILNTNSKSINNFKPGESLVVDLRWDGLPASRIESVGVSIFKLSGEHITGINTRDTLNNKNWIKKGRIELEIALNIAPGKYYLLIEVFEEPGKVSEFISGGLQFNINNAVVPWSGLAKLPYKWHEK